MNNQDQTQHPDSLLANNRGFEDESAPEAPPTNATKGTTKKSGELKANFMAVFGHGIGKVALIVTLFVIVVLSAFAMRGFASKPPALEQSTMNVPDAPVPQVTIDPIDEKEAMRRGEQALLKAQEASNKGQTYQPEFNPTVVNKATTTGINQPEIQGAMGENQASRNAKPPTPQENQANNTNSSQPPIAVTVPAGQSSAGGGNAQEEQRQKQAEIEKERVAHEKFVDQVRLGVREQAEDLLGKGGSKDGGIRGNGSYSLVSYLPRTPSTGNPSGGASATTSTGQGAVAIKPLIFKAGKAIFATLDSEVNTDDGGEVFATVRGGKYDGSRLIGKIEQAPRNIRLRFTVLAPQDDRPTVGINAIAIRESDAKQGVADTIDHHTLERYSALFAGSFLSGLSKAAMQPQGDTIILPSGQVIVSQPPMDDKRIAMLALGEVGINAGEAIRRNFSQPTTYITPANKGIGVIFLNDVNEK